MVSMQIGQVSSVLLKAGSDVKSVLGSTAEGSSISCDLDGAVMAGLGLLMGVVNR